MYAIRRLSATRAFLASTILVVALDFSGCKSSASAAPTDDASLTAALQSRISSDGALSAEPIQSNVQSGVATLTGNVSSEAARSLAAADAAQVAGIKTVVNNLAVQAPVPPVTAAAVPPPATQPVAPRKVSVPKPAPKPKAAPVVHESAPVEAPVQ